MDPSDIRLRDPDCICLYGRSAEEKKQKKANNRDMKMKMKILVDLFKIDLFQIMQWNWLTWGTRLLWAILMLQISFYVVRVKMHRFFGAISRFIGEWFQRNRSQNAQQPLLARWKLSCCRGPTTDVISATKQESFEFQTSCKLRLPSTEPTMTGEEE